MHCVFFEPGELDYVTIREGVGRAIVSGDTVSTALWGDDAGASNAISCEDFQKPIGSR